MSLPYPRHGQVCSKIDRLLGSHVDGHDLGHLVTNDAAVLTERNPDTVRGADVAFYRYTRVPKGPFPQGYLPVPPDVAFEVRSPDDRWSNILIKVGEYLNAGVGAVCVVDPISETLHIYRADQPVRILIAEDEFSLPDYFGDFGVPVRRFLQ